MQGSIADLSGILLAILFSSFLNIGRIKTKNIRIVAARIRVYFISFVRFALTSALFVSRWPAIFCIYN